MIRYGNHGAIPSDEQGTVRTMQLEGRGKNDAIRCDTVRLVRCDTAWQVQCDTYGKCDAA